MQSRCNQYVPLLYGTSVLRRYQYRTLPSVQIPTYRCLLVCSWGAVFRIDLLAEDGSIRELLRTYLLRLGVMSEVLGREGEWY